MLEKYLADEMLDFLRTTDGHLVQPVAPNRLARRFRSDYPNQVWVADSSSMPACGGWAYLAVVLDLYSRRVVGWAPQPTLTHGLALAALQDAWRRPSPGVLHHSVRGSQYARVAYQVALARAGMMARMSRTGNCYDNAPTGSFFASLKAEPPQTVFPRLAAVPRAVFDYIERFYDRQRRHSPLAYLSPLAYAQWYGAQRG